MTHEIQPSPSNEEKPIAFGTRLKQARDALGLDRKEVAIQLRLPEKIIIMMEKERYSADLPVTFIRGYIKAYGKYLQIPDFEINKALEPIKPKSTSPHIIPFSSRSLVPIGKRHDIMQIFSYLIVFSLTGLLSVWWYHHYAKNPTSLIETASVLLENKKPATEPLTKVPPFIVNPVPRDTKSPASSTTLANNEAKKHSVVDDDPYVDDM